MIKKILFIICSVLIFSCEERFDPNIENPNEPFLVIEGMINSNPGPYSVRISFSTTLIYPRPMPLSDYQVFIIDNLGNSEQLTEGKEGEYISSVNGIQGIVGRQYKVKVISPDGKTYESTFETMIAGGQLEDVYAEIEYREYPNSFYDRAGYQFYIDATLPDNDSSFILWKLEGTYKYESDFTIRWIYAGTLEWFYNPDSLYYCYKRDNIGETFVMQTKHLSGTSITRHPMHFVDTESRRLSIKYSLLVQQLMISEHAYHYWNGIADAMNSPNIHNLQSQHQLENNLKNIEDPGEVVLGYFLTAGVTEKRIFVDRPRYPVKFHYPICTFGIADFERYLDRRDFDPASYPLYVIETLGGYRGIPNQNCVDCRRKGGTIVVPDFWID